MKILGISGGTKGGRNDCACKEALRGAQAYGAEIEFIRLFDLDIQHCTGCRGCVAKMMQGKGNGCVLHDDFAWLEDKMLDADGIIFSIPIFETYAAGVFHTLMDRMGPRMDKGNNLMNIEMSKKFGFPEPDLRYVKEKAVSYIAIGGSDWMTAVENDFGIQAMVPKWTMIDREVFQWSATLLLEEDRMQQMYKIGENIADAAKDIANAVYKGDPGVCPHCHSRQFYIGNNGMVICGCCGIEGLLEKKEDGYQFTFAPEQETLAHDTLSGKAKHGADINYHTEREMKAMQTPEFREKKKFYADFIQASVPER